MPVRIIGREVNEDAIATARAAGHERVKCDVLHAPAHRKVTGYISSSPCQTFSQSGKGEGRKHLASLLLAARLVADGQHPSDAVEAVHDEALDVRSTLALHPLRVIRESQPTWVAMEQVRGVMPLWQEFATLMRERWGYEVRLELLHAEQYGVPQTRERAILVAVKREALDGGEVPWPVATHSRFHSRAPQKLDEGVERWISMAEALNWGMTERPYVAVAAGTDAGGTDPQCLGGSGARRTVNTEREGGRWIEKTHDDSPEFWNRPFDNFDRGPIPPVQIVPGGDPTWPMNRPSPTIVGSFAAEVVAAPGYRKAGDPPRQKTPGSMRVSVAEAGVLQSFRPDYPWQGGKSSQYQRVGDAIPPFLAAAILIQILALFPDGNVLEDFAGPGGWDEGARLAQQALAVDVADAA